MQKENTDKTNDWIDRALKNNPCVDIGGGNFRTTVCRLSFPNLWERSRPIPPNTEGKFGANLVFPVGANLKILKDAAAAVGQDKWGNRAGTMRLKHPFKDQAEMADRYAGYEQGGEYIIATSAKTRPMIVDPRNQAITDESRVYPGVWAVAIIRPFAYEQTVNKGVAFGLQGVMLVSDDKQLGGGGIDPGAAFGGVNVDASYNPAGAFGVDPMDD